MSPNALSTANVLPCFSIRVRGSRSPLLASMRYCESASAWCIAADLTTLLPGRLLGCRNEVLRHGKPFVLSCAVGAPARQHPAIQGQVIARHALGRELLLEPFADRAPIELTGEWHRSGCLSDVLDYKPGYPVLDDLRHRAVPEGDDGGSRRHRLDQHQTERLRPFDWKQQGRGFSEKPALLAVPNLPHKLDHRIVQERRDDLRKIFAVHRIDLSCHAQLCAGLPCNGDRPLGSLLRRSGERRGGEEGRA